MCAGRLPLRGSLRVSPRAFAFPVSWKDQNLPPSAGDFCYSKSHQNHLRRTAAATRFPARLARHAPRRTRAIHGPRTIGACSPVGLRCSAAFQGAASQNPCVSTGRCVAKSYRTAICAPPAFAFPVSYQDQKLPPSAGDFCYGKVTKTMCAERLPLRGTLRVSPDRRRAELGPSMALGQSALARLSRCDARQPSRRGQVKISMFLPVVCVALRAEQRICAIRLLLLLCRLLLKRQEPRSRASAFGG